MPFNLGNSFSFGTPLIRYLDTIGNGTGIKNATGNYSIVPQPFFIAPSAGQIFVITALLLQMSDNGPFGQSIYGSLATPLTNGLLVSYKRGATIVTDLLDGIPIKTNDNFYHQSYHTLMATFSAGVNTIVCRLINAEENGYSIVLNGNYSDRLEVYCQDDFSTLVDQTFKVNGYYG